MAFWSKKLRLNKFLPLIVAVVIIASAVSALWFLWARQGTTKGISSSTFGDGRDGVLYISTNTTDAPIDSAATGSAGSNTLSATNPSFTAGQKVMIHQTQGTNAGVWEINEIQSYSAGTISLIEPLVNSYSSKAQVLVLKQYTDVTILTNITLSAKPWNGTTGGILAFFANGVVTISGNISADGKGFRGGSAVSGNGSVGQTGAQGESSSGTGTQSTAANGSGGGGGQGNYDQRHWASGGGGGGHAIAGTTGNFGVGPWKYNFRLGRFAKCGVRLWWWRWWV